VPLADYIGRYHFPVIGDRLRDIRKRALLTQQELADKSGVGVTTIIRIENNQVEPQGRTIRKLAEALDVEPHELVKEAGEA
jgi:transcriptional regulator with XRE-family HTH domain